jgi:chemotaxis response regulator CheB
VRLRRALTDNEETITLHMMLALVFSARRYPGQVLVGSNEGDPARNPSSRVERMSASSIFVIGTSTGGLDALKRLVAQLPSEFPAPIFVVQHMSASANGDALRQALNQSGRLICKEAKDGLAFENGHIYLAPSDHHLMLVKGKMLVTKGAYENRSRPGIDPSFRSARWPIAAR